MRISDVLRVKGGQVVTVTPDTDVRHLLTVLAEHRIGAVVISHNGTSVDGIASERDIVRALAERGATVMSEAITAIYTAEVRTVTPETPLEEVMRMMTAHRIRHLPVVVDERLIRARMARRRTKALPGVCNVESDNAASRDAGSREPDRRCSAASQRVGSACRRLQRSRGVRSCR